jgi:hypothetical protein
MQQKKTQR